MLRAGGIRVAVLRRHPQQADGRRLVQFTDQRCVPARRRQPLPYGPGAQLGETDEFDGPSGQLLTQTAVTLLRRRRVRYRPRAGSTATTQLVRTRKEAFGDHDPPDHPWGAGADRTHDAELAGAVEDVGAHGGGRSDQAGDPEWERSRT